MYEKFKTKEFDYVTEKAYVNGKYFVDKTVIISYVYSCILKKMLRHETHIGCLIPIEDRYDYLCEMWGGGYDENDPLLNPKYDDYRKIYQERDLSLEIEKYCPNPELQNNYFFRKTFHKNKELPLYYTLFGDYEKDAGGDEESDTPFNSHGIQLSINKQNIKKYLRSIDKQILTRIQLGDIKPDSCFAFNSFRKSLDFSIKALYKDKNFNWLIRETDCDINEFEEPFISIYFKYVMESILAEFLKNENLVRCQYCGKIIIKKTASKIYCSKNIDGEDCRKKAQNKRYHEKNRTKVKKGTYINQKQ